MTFHPNPSWDPPQHHKVVRPVQLYRRVNVSSPESETRVSFFTACGSVLGLTRAYSAFGGESSAMVCKAARGSLSTEGGTFAPQWSRVVKLMTRVRFPLRESNRERPCALAGLTARHVPRAGGSYVRASDNHPQSGGIGERCRSHVTGRVVTRCHGMSQGDRERSR